MITIKELRKNFHTNGTDSLTGLIPLYSSKKPGSEYMGSIRQKDGKSYYIGYPTDKEILVNNLQDVVSQSCDFRYNCQKNWVDQKACDLSWCNGYRTELALHYLADRMGWERCDWLKGSGYNIGATGWGIRVFSLDTNCGGGLKDFDSSKEAKFHLSLSNSLYIPSPVFASYDEAMKWLKSVCWQILFGVGAELLSIASKLQPQELCDADLTKLSFKGGIFPEVEKFSLRQHLIDTLEHRLEILKRGETIKTTDQ